MTSSAQSRFNETFTEAWRKVLGPNEPVGNKIPKFTGRVEDAAAMGSLLGAEHALEEKNRREGGESR
jgi:hypothetical protein